MKEQDRDVIDVTPDDQRAVALRPPEAQAVTLWGTHDPAAIVGKATSLANTLAGVLEKQKLYSAIQGKRYVRLEGWQLLGTLLGVVPVVEWTRPLAQDQGWEARVEVRTLSGQVIGAGEAMCSRKEGRWRTADDYAIRAMAQTRASSRALRGPLGFVVNLAGFEATASEEMPAEEQPAQRTQAPKVDTLAEVKKKIAAELEHFRPEDRDGAIDAASHFVKDGKDYSIASVEAMMRMRKNERWLQATLGNLRAEVERRTAVAAGAGEQDELL